jgi:signal peptidase I
VLELTSPAVSPAEDNHPVAFDKQAASGLTENVAWPDGVRPIEAHRPWRPMVPELLAAAVVGLAVAVVTWFRMPPGPVVVFASLMLALAATEVVMVGGRTGRHRRGVLGGSRAAGRTKHRLNWLAELVLIVSIVLAVDVALEALVVKRYRTSSASMAPAIHVGQQLLVDRLSLRFQPPHRGDIVVFNPPAGSALHLCGEPHPGDQACPVPSPGRLTTSFVKRVVAVPGDRLAVIGARVYVNGKQQPEPRITGSISCDLCELPQAITIPPGYFFVMGDNRGQSDDSRDWGPIPRSWLIGRVFFSYWPLSRLAVY